MKRSLGVLILTIAALGVASGQTKPEHAETNSAKKNVTETSRIAPSNYLYIWAGDGDKRESDFLAVIDVRPAKPRYGRIVATLPVGEAGTIAHHTEHEMPKGGVLFANGFHAGKTFMFDLRNPESPRLFGSFGAAGSYTHPHSFVRLPNGNVLATFQMKG